MPNRLHRFFYCEPIFGRFSTNYMIYIIKHRIPESHGVGQAKPDILNPVRVGDVYCFVTNSSDHALQRLSAKGANDDHLLFHVKHLHF